MLRDEETELSWYRSLAGNVLGAKAHRASFLGGALTEWSFPEAPYILTEEQVRIVDEDVGNLVTLVSRLAKEFAHDGRHACDLLAPALGLPDWVWDWMRRLPAGEHDIGYGRPDTHFDGTKVHLLETNLTSLAGAGFELSCAIEYLREHPASASCGVELVFLDPLVGLGRALESAINASSLGADALVCFLSTRAAALSLADVENPYGKTRARIARSTDVPMTGACVEDLVISNGKVYLDDGRRVTHTLCSMHSPQDVEKSAPFLALWHCAAAGQVVLLDSLADTVKSHKAFLSMIADPLSGLELTPAERALVDRMVPETFHVKGSERLLDEKASWVLKKAKSAQGVDVRLGWLADPASWRESVENAVQSGGWVAQRYVAPPERVMPYIVDGRVATSRIGALLSPFVVGGRVCGHAVRCYSRSLATPGSTGSVLDLAIRFTVPAAWRVKA